jgi:hypothetical protein
MKNTIQFFFRRFSPCIVWVIAGLIILISYVRFAPQHWSFESQMQLERIRKELPLAEARWKSHNITEYEIDVDAFAHPVFCHDPSEEDFSGWHLNIDQGEIVFDNDVQKGYVEACAVNDFLPPRVFEVIRQRIKSANPQEEYLKIDFDPEYGFVTKYVNDANNRRNSTLHVYYFFTNFRPKKP